MRHLPLPPNCKRSVPAGVIQNKQHNGTILVLKGDCLQAAAAKVRGTDAPSGRMHETTGLSDRVIVLGVDHAVRGSTAVNRYKSAAGVAEFRNTVDRILREHGFESS